MWMVIALGSIIGAMVLVLVIAALRRGSDGAGGFPPGTRAFEAALTIPLVRAEIERLRREQAATSDVLASAKLQSAIAFYALEGEKLQALVDARDLSPGQGFVGLPQPPH